MTNRQHNAKPKSFIRSVNFAMWMAALFFFAGYGLTHLTRNLPGGPAVTMPVAAIGAMWVGSRIGKPMRAAAGGMALGARAFPFSWLHDALTGALGGSPEASPGACLVAGLAWAALGALAAAGAGRRALEAG